MSMLGKIDEFMYATNHAEETTKNLKKAGSWVKEHVQQYASTPSSSASAQSNPTTTPSPTASASSTPIEHSTFHNVLLGNTPKNTFNPSQWFTDANLITKTIVVLVIIAVGYLIGKVVMNVLRRFIYS